MKLGEWKETWPGQWNIYRGGTNVATIERDIIFGGYLLLVREDPKASWRRADTLDAAKSVAVACLATGSEKS